MGTLTAVILTCNEAKNIRGVIRSAKLVADQVLIVDSGSSDETVALAEKLGAQVIYRAWDQDFAAQRNFALTGVSCDWVLYLDADERLTAAAVEKIKAIKAGPLDHQYSLERINIAFGHEFHRGAFGPDRVTRLFPAGQVRWEHKVHERPVCPLPLTALTESLRHFTYDSFQQWWDKAGHYTTIWARDAFEQGRRATAAQAAHHALGGMFKVYLLEGGILEGSMGFIATLQHGIYTAMKYMKLVERGSLKKKEKS